MRRCCPLVAVLVLLVLAVPASARVVARDGGVVLKAAREHGDLCLRLEGSRSCGDGTVRTPFDALTFPGKGPLALAVAPTVTAVSAGGRRYPTVRARGFRPRFLLVARPGRYGLLRFYDAGGRLIGAAFATQSGDHRVAGSRRPVSSRMTVFRERDLEPTPRQLDRTVVSPCFRLRSRNGGSNACSSGTEVIQPEVADACSPQPAIAGALVRPDVRRVRLRLGSGAVLEAPTRPLPRAFGRRAVAVLVPAGEAVRSAAALDRAGRVLATRRLAQPPTGAPCPQSGPVVLSLYADGTRARGPRTPSRVLASAHGHRLRVAEGHADELCDGIDRISAFNCDIPPTDAGELVLQRRGRVVGGIVSRDTARVVLRLDDGRRIAAATRPARYGGRYDGLVRFVLLTVPRHRTVRRVVARSSTGFALGEGVVTRRSASRVLRRGQAGGVPFRVTRRLPGIDGLQARRCVSFRDHARLPLCDDDARAAPLEVIARCGAPGVIVAGVRRPSSRPVVAELADGRELVATDVRLGRGAAYLLRLPTDAALRAVRVPGRRPARVEAAAPPLVQQCGYVRFALF